MRVPSFSLRTSAIVIRNARKVAEPRLDHTEELTVERRPAGEVASLIRDGRIDHALVVAGLLWWLAVDRPVGGPPRATDDS